MYKIAFKLNVLFKDIEERLTELNKTCLSPNRASVLILLPGINEIFRMDTQLKNSMMSAGKLRIFIMHKKIR